MDAVYNALRRRKPLLISEMKDMTSNLGIVSARQSNESIRSDRKGTFEENWDHGRASYVVSTTTFSTNAQTRNVPSATPRHTVSTNE